MAFEDGHKKIGGKQKGTPLKSTMAKVEILKAATEDFASKLRENNIEPIKTIADTMSLLEPFELCQVMLALCKFKYPTFKPVDVKKHDNPYAGLTKIELLAQMKAGVSVLEDEINEEVHSAPSQVMRAAAVKGDE